MCDREALAYRAILATLIVFVLGYVTGCIRQEGGPHTHSESLYKKELQKKKDAIMLKNMERVVD